MNEDVLYGKHIAKLEHLTVRYAKQQNPEIFSLKWVTLLDNFILPYQEECKRHLSIVNKLIEINPSIPEKIAYGLYQLADWCVDRGHATEGLLFELRDFKIDIEKRLEHLTKYGTAMHQEARAHFNNIFDFCDAMEHILPESYLEENKAKEGLIRMTGFVIKNSLNKRTRHGKVAKDYQIAQNLVGAALYLSRQEKARTAIFTSDFRVQETLDASLKHMAEEGERKIIPFKRNPILIINSNHHKITYDSSQLS